MDLFEDLHVSNLLFLLNNSLSLLEFLHHILSFSLNQNSENTTELNHYSINPFSQSTSSIEEYQLKISDFNKDKLFYDYNIPENIDHFLQKNQTGTPTLMFINNPSNDSETWTEAAKIASNIITLSSDPLTTYNNLKKFPNNVMERVSFEMNSIYSENEKNEFIDEQKVLEMVMMFADQSHISQENAVSSASRCRAAFH